MESYWRDLVSSANLFNHRRHGGHDRHYDRPSYDLCFDIFSTRKIMDQDQMGSGVEETEHIKVIYIRNNNMPHNARHDSVVFHAPV